MSENNEEKNAPVEEIEENGADCACCDPKVAIFHCADECGLCCDVIKVQTRDFKLCNWLNLLLVFGQFCLACGLLAYSWWIWPLEEGISLIKGSNMRDVMYAEMIAVISYMLFAISFLGFLIIMLRTFLLLAVLVPGSIILGFAVFSSTVLRTWTQG